MRLQVGEPKALVLGKVGHRGWLVGWVARLLLTGLVPLLVLLVACGGSNDGSGQQSSSKDYQGTRLSGTAPDFSLTDQNGSEVSLSDFRGKVVALTFMDSRCDETCPLTSLELLKTQEMLVEDSGDVVYLGVNVNADFAGREDVEAATHRFLLDRLPEWHFLTGSQEQLSPVWQDYFIEVQAQPGEEDYQHTPGVFLVDRNGDLKWYVSVPFVELGLTEEWEGPSLHELLAGHIKEIEE